MAYFGNEFRMRYPGFPKLACRVLFWTVVAVVGVSLVVYAFAWATSVPFGRPTISLLPVLGQMVLLGVISGPLAFISVVLALCARDAADKAEIWWADVADEIGAYYFGVDAESVTLDMKSPEVRARVRQKVAELRQQR